MDENYWAKKRTFGLRLNRCSDEYSYGSIGARPGDLFYAAIGITMEEKRWLRKVNID